MSAHHLAQAPDDTAFRAPRGVITAGVALLVLGAAGLGFGIVTEPWRGWSNFLLGSHYATGVALGAGVIMAFYYVTSAGWWPVVKRITEAMTMYLPVGLATMLIAGGFGMHALYEWSDAEVVARDHLLQHKQGLLNPTAWFVVTVVAFAGWILLTFMMRKQSLEQDKQADDSRTTTAVRLSAVFLVFYGLTVTLTSLVWLSSIEPHWFSTLFGVYQFIGMFCSASAALTLIVVYLKKQGFLPYVNEVHYHDLGKMLFAFSTFWAYIWICQYLLIWYSNIPEETGYFIVRNEGPWLALFLLNPVLNWLLPFFMMMKIANKRSPKWLAATAIVLLAGHWLDLYLQILPGTAHWAAHHGVEVGHGLFFGPIELGGVLCPGGLFMLVVFKMLEKAPLLPRNDPYVEESLNFQPGPGPQGA